MTLAWSRFQTQAHPTETDPIVLHGQLAAGSWVVLEKTGLLTTGQPILMSLATLAGISPSTAMSVAAALEAESQHPFAVALRQQTTPLHASDITELEGLGVKGVIEGETYYLGGNQLRQQRQWNLPTPLNHARMEAENNGASLLYLVQHGVGVIALFSFSDTIRAESYHLVRQLRQQGVKVALLTSDSYAAAQAVATALKLDAYFAEVPPHAKGSVIRQLQAGGSHVIMVGADDQALHTADLGIPVEVGKDALKLLRALI